MRWLPIPFSEAGAFVNSSLLSLYTDASGGIPSDFFSSSPICISTVLECNKAVKRSISDLHSS